MKNKLVSPVVKWVGGKRQLIHEIYPLLPKKITSYCEPFLGGGAILFYIQPNKCIINDLNKDLIEVYEIIRDSVDLLIEDLKKHKNTSEYFYKIRDIDRNKSEFQTMSKIERASRILYLNKTCFNGLFRVNSLGEFNSPFGYYKNPNIVNEPILRAVNKYFASNSINIFNEDFSETLNRVGKGCFVYLDPPYDPVSDTSNFTGYNKGGFNRDEQIRLKECCDYLNKRNIKFLLSNSSTEFIKNLYHEYNIFTISAKRSINSNGHGRGKLEEVLIRNYE